MICFCDSTRNICRQTSLEQFHMNTTTDFVSVTFGRDKPVETGAVSLSAVHNFLGLWMTDFCGIFWPPALAILWLVFCLYMACRQGNKDKPDQFPTNSSKRSCKNKKAAKCNSYFVQTACCIVWILCHESKPSN